MSGITTPTAGPTDATALMRYDANKKSALVAYLLWFFLGGLGVHRFYLGRTGSAVVMLLLTIISAALTVVIVGYIGWFILGVWWLIDALLIPGIVRRYNNDLIAQLSR